MLLAFVDSFQKTLSTSTVTFRDAHLLQSTNAQPICFLFSFFIKSKLVNKRGRLVRIQRSSSYRRGVFLKGRSQHLRKRNVNFVTSRDIKIKCGGYVSLVSFAVLCCQIIVGNTLIFLNYLEQEKTSRMASSPECITWMVVGMTKSVTIIALNSLTVIAFCRDRNLHKRSTYLVIRNRRNF